jgi:TonB-dependent SusC/RagA subfamily outer membrane receptor
MTPALYAILLCLSFTVTAWAQDTSKTSKSTSDKPFVIVDATYQSNDKPLVILNDKVYKKRLKSIDANAIESVTVLKGPDAVAKYGTDAKNGVVIKCTVPWMKKLKLCII